MVKKRPIIRLPLSAAALTLVLYGGVSLAASEPEPATEADTPKDTAFEPAPSKVTASPAPKPEQKPEAEAKETPAQTRTPASGTPRTQWRHMSPEERRAQHEQRFDKMLERVTKRRQEVMRRHQEIQEVAERWDSYWKILDAMTPEQKEAVYAIFGTGGKGCHHRSKGRRELPRRSMPPMMDPSEFDFPSDPPFSPERPFPDRHFPPMPGYDYNP